MKKISFMHEYLLFVVRYLFRVGVEERTMKYGINVEELLSLHLRLKIIV